MALHGRWESAYYSGGLASQADWRGSKLGICSTLFCIHRINQANAANGSAVMHELCRLRYCHKVYIYIYTFIRLDGQQTAHNTQVTQLENTIKHNHTQLKER